MSWMSRSGSSSRATISRYFASDSCPWPRMALALVSISCGRRTVGVGDVALAADRQQQRMDAGGVDGVDGVDAGDDRRDDRAGQLVDQLAERRCLPAAAGRPTVNGQMAPVAVVDALDAQHREVVRQAVIAEVVAERPFGLAARAGRSCRRCTKSASAGIGRPPSGATSADPTAAQGAGEGQLGQPFGQRHHGGDGQGRAGRRRRR